MQRLPGIGVPLLGVLGLETEMMSWGTTPDDVYPNLPPGRGVRADRRRRPLRPHRAAPARRRPRARLPRPARCGAAEPSDERHAGDVATSSRSATAGRRSRSTCSARGGVGRCCSCTASVSGRPSPCPTHLDAVDRARSTRSTSSATAPRRSPRAAATPPRCSWATSTPPSPTSARSRSTAAASARTSRCSSPAAVPPRCAASSWPTVPVSSAAASARARRTSATSTTRAGPRRTRSRSSSCPATSGRRTTRPSSCARSCSGARSTTPSRCARSSAPSGSTRWSAEPGVVESSIAEALALYDPGPA